MLTTSPTYEYSQRSLDPMLPQNTFPVVTPILQDTLSSSSVKRTSIAADTARHAKFSVPCGGTPNAAMRTLPLSSTRNCRREPSNLYRVFWHAVMTSCTCARAWAPR